TPPAPDAPSAAAPDTTMNSAGMNSAGWLEQIVMGLEREAMSDISMLPDAPSALAREWRSFDRDGSALGALANFGWVILAACLAVIAERLVARGLSNRLRYRLQNRMEGPSLPDLLLLMLSDLGGVAVFAGLFVYSRHWLMGAGVTISLFLLAADA